jgi:hypothetical protein
MVNCNRKNAVWKRLKNRDNDLLSLKFSQKKEKKS